MKAEDVGLSRNLPFFKTPSTAGVTPKVSCTTINKSEKFWLCIFFLPANAVIPLHNHPGMTVFNKLLLGKVHIKAYDLVNASNEIDSISPSKREFSISIYGSKTLEVVFSARLVINGSNVLCSIS
ncbi:putative cysteamine dioxygenase [Helianthus annuus]|nr:putative cysteamine dioxygenase [Helianthus annuus]